MGGSMKKLWVVFGVAAALSSCSKDNNNKNTVVNSGLEPVACEFGVSDGLAVDASIDAADQFKTAAFGKEYRVNWLSAVAKTSILETTRIIPRLANVEIYKGKEKGPSSCQSYVHLASMPGDLDYYWSKATADDDKAGAEYFTGGLYIPQASEDSIAGNRTKSQIIVRRNQSRWTIVHEFMHHNFHQRALEQGKYSPGQGKHLNALAEELDSSGYFDAVKYRYHDTVRRILAEKEEKIIDLFDTFDQMIVGSTLEEITIENELRKLYQSKELEYVPSSSASNAAWYIEASSEKAADVYTKTVMPILDEFLTPAETYSMPIAPRLREFKARFASRVAEARRLKWENPLNRHEINELTKDIVQKTGQIDETSFAPKAPCGHDHSDQVIEQITEVADRFRI